MQQVGADPLGKVLEMDETLLGGRHAGEFGRVKGGKEIVVGIKQRNGELRFFHAEDVKSGTLARFIKENVSDDAMAIITDDFKSYPPAMRETGHEFRHFTVNHSARQYVDGEIFTNSIESEFGLLKRALVGSYHRLSAKHLTRYLQEFSYRATQRKNPQMFEDVLSRIASNPRLPFRVLVDGEQEVLF